MLRSPPSKRGKDRRHDAYGLDETGPGHGPPPGVLDHVRRDRLHRLPVRDELRLAAVHLLPGDEHVGAVQSSAGTWGRAGDEMVRLCGDFADHRRGRGAAGEPDPGERAAALLVAGDDLARADRDDDRAVLAYRLRLRLKRRHILHYTRVV